MLGIKVLVFLSYLLPFKKLSIKPRRLLYNITMVILVEQFHFTYFHIMQKKIMTQKQIPLILLGHLGILHSLDISPDIYICDLCNGDTL